MNTLIKKVLTVLDPRCNPFSLVFPHTISTPIDVDVTRDEAAIRVYMNNSYYKNSLATLHPNLAKEWHPTKNGSLTPHMYTPSHTYRAWWLCSTCGHEWPASIRQRAEGSGCKTCYLNRVKESSPNGKRIYQYTSQGEYLREWQSASKAGRELKINPANISSCALHFRSHAGGYRWEYQYFERLEKTKKTKPNRQNMNGKPVLQINLSGDVIAIFDSLNEAQRKTGINATSISKALHGHIKHAGGYSWKFKHPFEQ